MYSDKELRAAVEHLMQVLAELSLQPITAEPLLGIEVPSKVMGDIIANKRLFFASGPAAGKFAALSSLLTDGLTTDAIKKNPLAAYQRVIHRTLPDMLLLLVTAWFNADGKMTPEFKGLCQRYFADEVTFDFYPNDTDVAAVFFTALKSVILLLLDLPFLQSISRDFRCNLPGVSRQVVANQPLKAFYNCLFGKRCADDLHAFLVFLKAYRELSHAISQFREVCDEKCQKKVAKVLADCSLSPLQLVDAFVRALSKERLSIVVAEQLQVVQGATRYLSDTVLARQVWCELDNPAVNCFRETVYKTSSNPVTDFFKKLSPQRSGQASVSISGEASPKVSSGQLSPELVSPGSQSRGRLSQAAVNALFEETDSPFLERRHRTKQPGYVPSVTPTVASPPDSPERGPSCCCIRQG